MLWEITWDNAVFLNIRGTRIYYILQSVVQKKTEVSSENAREESNLAAARKNDFMAASW